MQGTQARSIRKVTAMLLALCMVMSFFPWMTAAAAEGDAVLGDSGNIATEQKNEPTQEGDQIQDSGPVTMSAPASLPVPGELEQLPTPENLVFGYDEHGAGTNYELFGVLSFDSIDAPEDCECNYWVSVYRDAYMLERVSYIGYEIMRIPLSYLLNESGEYMFEVIATDPSGGYPDSDPALVYYNYDKPETSLAEPENLRWIEENDKLYFVFDAVEGAELYELASYLDGTPRGHGWYLDRTQHDATWSMSLENILTGTCTFKVRALSSNIETIANGEFSELSPEYKIGEETEDIGAVLADLLAAINNSSITASEALETVKALNTDELAAAMQSDPDVLSKIEELEAAYKALNSITVSSSVDSQISSVLDVGKISIVGAALNAASGPVTLNFSSPSQSVAINQSQYKNYMQFSITLDGVADASALDVPVRIAMPIPVGVSASRLCILHYTDYGTYETVTYTNNGDGTISFTLLHFSEFVFANEATAGVWAGDGSQNTPYQIADADDLALLATNVNAGNDYTGTYFVVTADIDLAGVSNWTPIGNFDTEHPFNGFFDGNFKQIQNLTIDRPTNDYIGLFGYVNNDGVVISLGIESGSVKGRHMVGGVSGLNFGKIQNCYNRSAVIGTGDYIGGVVGWNTGITTNCYNTGSVGGKSSVGGVAGISCGTGAGTKTVQIQNCYNTGSVTGTGDSVGGVVGEIAQNGITVKNCYNTGFVRGNNNVGGIVGKGTDTASTQYCLNTGSVMGNNYVGGVIGLREAGVPVTSCYNTGNLSSAGTNVGGISGGGGTTALLTGNYRFRNIKINGEVLPATQDAATDNNGGRLTLVSLYAKETYSGNGWTFGYGDEWIWFSDGFMGLGPMGLMGSESSPLNIYFDVDLYSQITYADSARPTVSIYYRVGFQKYAISPSAATPDGSKFIDVTSFGSPTVMPSGSNYLHWQGVVDGEPVSVVFGPYNVNTAIDTSDIWGVTIPSVGGTPVTAITETAQYTGTVNWNHGSGAFVQGNAYTATITLTPKEGYTLTGVAQNFFTVAGATATNSANSGVITAAFPTVKADQAALSIVPVTGKKFNDSAFPLSTTGGSGTGAVTYTLISGPGSATPGGMLTITGAGNIVVTATKADDGTYNAETSEPLTIIVGKGGQAALIVEASPNSGTFGGAVIGLTATGGSSAGSDIYAVVSGPGTISGNTLTATGAGTIVVTATRAGDANWNAVTSAPLSIVIANADQAAPAAPTMVSGTANSITLTAINGAEYSRDNGSAWQASPIFTGLSPNTGYTFVARYPSKTNYNASPASAASSVFTTLKLSQSAPGAPTMASKSAVQVSLTPISGAEYRQGTGVWQDSPIFSGLTPSTSYTFYARLAGDTTHEPSPASPGLTVTTDKAALGGTVTITGTHTFAQVLTAVTSDLSSTPSATLGTLSYQWTRGGTAITGATGSTYTLAAADVGAVINVTVTAANCSGSISSSNAAAVAKAGQAAPSSVSGGMTVIGQTYTYTVMPISGAEYKRDSGNWQDSNVFQNIAPNSSHTFYARLKATNTHNESADVNTGAVNFSKLPQNAPALGYGVTGSYDGGGTKTITITPVAGAEYQFNSSGYSAVNTYTSLAEETVMLYIRMTGTATHEASVAASTTVNTAKQNQNPPAAFTLTYSANADTDYTVTIPTVTGAEYSFDNVTFSQTNTKTGCLPGQVITGYMRKAATTEYNVSSVISNSVTLPLFQVKTPTASPNGGNFTTSVSVTLSCASNGASIFYTTDGSTPTVGSTLYSSSFTLTDSATVKAIAVKAGMTDSSVLTVTFTVPILSGDATLSALTIGSGTLTPAFNPATTNYTATVANSVSSVTVTATANHASATVSGVGAKTLSVGTNTISITVTAQDGTIKTYTINITRENSGSTGNGGGGGSSSGGSGSSGGGSSSNITINDNQTPLAGAGNTTQPIVASINLDVTVDKDGNATITVTDSMMKDAIEKAQAEAKRLGKEADGIVIEVKVTNTNGVKSLTAKFDQATLGRLNTAGAGLSVSSSIFCFTLDSAAVKELNTQAKGGVTFSTTPITKLSDAATAAIGSRPVFDFTVKDGSGKTITSYGKGTITRGIKYSAVSGEKTGNLFIVKIVDGKVQWIDKSSYDGGWVIWSGDSNSVYGVGYKTPVPAFTDTTSHWAKNDIDFVASRGLISGTTATTFAPNTAITRADFLMALGKLSGADVSGYKTSSFTDVANTNAAMPYIEWAVQNKIVQGIGNNKFGPDQQVTREQMAVMMVNYAKATSYTLPVSRQAVTFADDAKISAYAKDAVKAIQQTGVISGKPNNLFDPQGNATRGEASAILHRFVELVIDEGTARGWVQNDAGQWQYINVSGKAVTGWLTTTDGNKYWFDDKSIMVSGKWMQIGSKWYYFYSDGKLATSTTIEGYEVGADGARK